MGRGFINIFNFGQGLQPDIQPIKVLADLKKFIYYLCIHIIGGYPQLFEYDMMKPVQIPNSV
jgi:hypothetical protein